MLNKILRMRYEVVEICDNGLRVTHILQGSKHDVQKDIQMYKDNARDYQIVGKGAMIIWA